MDAITFTVPGQPVPQPRPRISTWGGRGRAYTPARHPIHAYRQAVTLAAIAAARRANLKPLDCPIVLEVECVFGRPPSHMTKSGTLTKSAPVVPPKCDWDNLGKGVCDAITDSRAVWMDDELVVDGRTIKRYARPGEAPATRVTIRRL
jgi:Holliday junction resolvase RusA-like endonuclease